MPNLWYPKSASAREGPMWESSLGAFRYTGIEKARVLFPRAITPETGALAAQIPSAIEANVGAVVIECAIEANVFSYNASGAGSANAVTRFVLFSLDGATQLFNLTDAVGAATGVRTITISPVVFLFPGIYYIFDCLSSGTTSPLMSHWTTTNGPFNAGGTGEPDIEGVLTITAGAAPTTLDPTALTTPAVDRTLCFRLDGTD